MGACEEAFLDLEADRLDLRLDLLDVLEVPPLDLLVVGDPRVVQDRFEENLPRLLRREFPTRSWTVGPSAARAPSPALLSADGFNVRVQLLPATAGWAAWRRVPTQRRPVFAELCGRPPDPRAYRRVPAATEDTWHSQLAHQAGDVPDAAHCFGLVADAVDAIQR